MKKLKILLILFQIVLLKSITAQPLDTTKTIEQRLILTALNDLWANVEMADTLNSALNNCGKLLEIKNEIILNQKEIIDLNEKNIAEKQWQIDNLLKENKRKGIINKITLIGLIISLALIPIL